MLQNVDSDQTKSTLFALEKTIYRINIKDTFCYSGSCLGLTSSADNVN